MCCEAPLRLCVLRKRRLIRFSLSGDRTGTLPWLNISRRQFSYILERDVGVAFFSPETIRRTGMMINTSSRCTRKTRSWTELVRPQRLESGFSQPKTSKNIGTKVLGTMLAKNTFAKKTTFISLLSIFDIN